MYLTEPNRAWQWAQVAVCKAVGGSVLLLTLSACCSRDRHLYVSQDRVDLTVGGSLRPQWSVGSGEGGSLICYPVFHYDNREAPERFRWESSDPRVATVDATGTIRGVEAGNTVVVGETGKLRESIPVTVRAGP